MVLNRGGFFALLVLSLASLAPAQFTQVTGTAADFVPEEQVKVDAQLEKEGRLILTKAISRVPLDPNQKAQLKQILDGRTATEKQFREIHKVPNATIRAFNLEQTRLAIEAIRQMLTPDQWNQFCEAQVASQEHEAISESGTQTVIVEGRPVVPSVDQGAVIVVEKHPKHVHKEVKVIKVVKVHKAPKHHHVKVVRLVHPAHVAHPPVHHAPVHHGR